MLMQKRTAIFIILSFLILIIATMAHSRINQKRIAFLDARDELTKEYMDKHYDKSGVYIAPKMIIILANGFTSVDDAWAFYNNEALDDSSGFAEEKIRLGGQLNVSVHFLVDTDGTVYQILDEDLMARHTIGLNHTAIAIANLGGTLNAEGTGYVLSPTEAQLEANEFLVKYLKAKSDFISYLIGHHEYLKFKETPLWKENIAGYDKFATERSDPGDEFMRLLRERVYNLRLLRFYGEQTRHRSML